MACSTCSSVKKEDGSVAGCKSNGGCSSGGCNKLNVFDWLSNMDMPAANKFNIVEVRFKNGRKEFFKNQNNLELVTGEPVVVDVPNGHHIGYVSLTGELVRLQMRKKSVKEKDVRTIYRIASLKDLEKFESTRNKEMNTLYKTKEIVQDMGLEMKLTDVEYQADNTKATFYYSADERVDFRELIKVLANEFRIRIEMRQISLRQEAGRLGGIGSCGRELCCSTWLTDFKSVSTAAARYQKLSLNPSKLSGQCGRLKCCLNYELDTYVEALKDIPEIDRPLLTEKGEARLQKTDIFRRIMWFGYDGENTWHPLEVSRVDEIIALNKKKKKPATLAENSLDLDKTDGGGLNSDLERLDNKYKNKSGSKNKRRRKSNNKRRNNRKNSPQGNATNQKRSPKKQKK